METGEFYENLFVEKYYFCDEVLSVTKYYLWRSIICDEVLFVAKRYLWRSVFYGEVL